jgi:hypothetical protein
MTVPVPIRQETLEVAGVLMEWRDTLVEGAI